MIPLPIDAVISRIQDYLRQSPNLIVEAPPGSGKTTRVPPALLDLFAGEVWVLEPRRLATRLAARRVAYERGERLGETIGYQVRFEEVAGPKTRLRFMTEGVLTRRMISDPQLRGVSAVVLDEFHERHLEGDLALALLRRLQENGRPDLRLVAMSATIEAEPLVEYLGNCETVRAEGRLFEIDVQYGGYSPKSLDEQVAGALDSLLKPGPELAGDVLVFLPGAAEIRRAVRACQPLAARHNLLLLPLHGDLTAEEQDRAVGPADRTKIILSTNVAESSVTVEGVRAVIDSGLARVATDSPWTGMPTLVVARISKASATQRAGRAGRTAPGRVVRLYSAEDFARRPEHDTPEIARRELSHTLLDLKAMGAEDIRWLEAPPPEVLAAANDLLARLGAVDAHGTLTPTGREMALLPLHPRLARFGIEAGRRKVLESGCAIAAMLNSGAHVDGSLIGRDAGLSDLLVLLETKWLPTSKRVHEHLLRSAARLFPLAMVRASDSEKPPKTADDQALLISALAAFPDRVARRRSTAGRKQKHDGRHDTDLVMASRGTVLSSWSVVKSELMVAVDVEDRSDREAPRVCVASAIEPEWLVDLFPDRVVEKKHAEWNRAAERVEVRSALEYDGLVIEESRSGGADSAEATALLAEKAMEAGYARFVDAEEFEHFLARVSFAAEHSALEPLSDADIRSALETLCAGLRSFAELKTAAQSGGLLRVLEARVGGGRRQLDQLAPEAVRLAGGRQVRINYSVHQPPWIASRLQDFFGMRETPRIGGGRVPLVIHLLAPNQRPVQVTQDLAGFWERHYPQVRRELSRRYPRHRWPEDPLA